MTAEHLFAAWQEVLARIDAAKHILLLSDFDGTLTPIVARPELAYLPYETHKVLQKLAQCPEYTVAIISGRALDDLKDRVGVPGVVYAGNYGLEIEAPGFRSVNPDADKARSLLNNLYQELRLGLVNVSGIIVENKGLTLSVHYRLVDVSESNRISKTFEHITKAARGRGEIEVTAGKKVYEIKPAISWHKGKVIDLLLRDHTAVGSADNTLPFFLGDDLSDELGFDAVDKFGGVSIFIGEEWYQSKARYYLMSPSEVNEFLERLLQARGQYSC